MFHSELVYDKKADCQSKVRPDFERVVNVDEKGDEHVFYQLVDYPKIQSSLGEFDQWSLRSLMSAGIDPAFGIKTGYGTRLEGLGAVNGAIDRINEILDSESKKVE